jgi:hypothetical protein
MIIRCCRTFVCLLTLMPAASFGQAARSSAQVDVAKDKGTDDQIVRMTQEVVAAEVRGDMPQLDRLYADNYVHMHEGGLVENKDVHKLSLVSSGVREYKAADISQLQVYSFGAGAIISGRESWEQLKGVTQHLFVAFWVQEQGRWRLAAWVAKPVPKEVEPRTSK